MKKLKTILPKDPNDLSKVIDGKLMEGISYFKIKIDGTACMIKDGKPYCRYDARLFKKKRGKLITFTLYEVKAKLPEGAIPCQEPDEKSGHWPHWIPCESSNPEHKYNIEGFNNLENKMDGTYECIGPKIQNNKHGEETYVWIPHFSHKLDVNIDGWEENPYEFFKVFLKEFKWEGLVAYNSSNEPIGKIRRSDFGYKNYIFNKASDIVK